MSNRWDALHGTYLTGRSYIDGAEALQIEMEKKWGADRLRLLVSQELREKFDRQRYLFRQAIEFGPLENVRRESQRMITALYALDGAAKASGASPIDAEVMEIALANGKVLAIVGDQDDARRAYDRADGRRMVVYTLEEIAHILADLPSVNEAKLIWPGATVTKVRRHVLDPLDVIAHPTGFDDELNDLWTTEQKRMRQKRTIIPIAATSLAMALTPAMAQSPKADKLDVDAPRVVRAIPITPSFDQRWFGPAQADRWISNQPPPSDRFTPHATQQPAEAQNRSTGLPEAVGIVPVPGNRLRHDPIQTQMPKAKPLVTAAAGDICTRHGLRKVWQGRTWRCR